MWHFEQNKCLWDFMIGRDNNNLTCAKWNGNLTHRRRSLPFHFLLIILSVDECRLFSHTFAQLRVRGAKAFKKTRNLNKCLLWNVSAELEDKRIEEIGGNHKNSCDAGSVFYVNFKQKPVKPVFLSTLCSSHFIILFSVLSNVHIKGIFTSICTPSITEMLNVSLFRFDSLTRKSNYRAEKISHAQKNQTDTVHYTRALICINCCVLAHLRQSQTQTINPHLNTKSRQYKKEFKVVRYHSYGASCLSLPIPSIDKKWNDENETATKKIVKLLKGKNKWIA